MKKKSCLFSVTVLVCMMMAVMPSASAQTGIILPDVNIDGKANVGDVTGLIDYLLSNDGSATWSNQRLSAYDFDAVANTPKSKRLYDGMRNSSPLLSERWYIPPTPTFIVTPLNSGVT